MTFWWMIFWYEEFEIPIPEINLKLISEIRIADMIKSGSKCHLVFRITTVKPLI